MKTTLILLSLYGLFGFFALRSEEAGLSTSARPQAAPAGTEVPVTRKAPGATGRNALMLAGGRLLGK